METRSEGRTVARGGLVGRYRGVVSLAVVALAVAGAVAGAAAVGGTGAASGASDGGQAGVTELESCAVIDEPGRYELTADVRGAGNACLHVRASDVVLDGNGHVVTGTNATNVSAGVLVHNGSASRIEQAVAEPTNVTVRDLRVTGWASGVRTGEFVSDGPPVTLANVTAADNGAGFVLYGAGESTLVDLTATGNDGDGVYLWESTAVSGRNLTVSNNGGNGLHLGQSVLDGNFSDVRATGNARTGVLVGTGSVDVRIADAYVANNSGAGVGFSDSDGTLLLNATIENNGGPGVASQFGEADSVVDATVSGNAVAYDAADDQPRYGVVATGFRLGNGVSAAFDANVSRLDEAERVPALPDGVSPAGPAANVSVGEGEPRASLAFPADADVVAGGGDLRVWRYANGTWTEVANVSVDRDAGTVTATVRSGGIVAPVVTGRGSSGAATPTFSAFGEWDDADAPGGPREPAE